MDAHVTIRVRSYPYNKFYMLGIYMPFGWQFQKVYEIIFDLKCTWSREKELLTLVIDTVYRFLHRRYATIAIRTAALVAESVRLQCVCDV